MQSLVPSVSLQLLPADTQGVLINFAPHTPKPLMEHNHSFQFNNASRHVINIQLHMLSPVLCKQ